MMHDSDTVLLFGASKGVGLALAKLLRERNVNVWALVRPRSDTQALTAMGVHIVAGNALDGSDIAKAFAAAGKGCHVVSTLGGREGDRLADDEGNGLVIDQAALADINRFVLVTAIGCGDMAPYRSPRAIAAFGAIVDAKTRAEEHLRSVLPDGTILRPGGLKSEPRTGRGILSTDSQIHGFIHRADMAELIWRSLCDDRTAGGTFVAVDAAQAQSVNPIQAYPLAEI